MSSDTVTVVLDRREMAARGRIGGLTTSSRHDMAAIAAHAREGRWQRLLQRVDPNGDLEPVERDRRAAALHRADMSKLSLEGLRARNRKKAAPAGVVNTGTASSAVDPDDDSRAT